MMNKHSFNGAMEAIDQLHEEDPDRVNYQGRQIGAELLYAIRMSERLKRIAPGASEVLQLAVRAQHLCRWRMPRTDYPATRPGYLRWRREQAKAHAALATKTLREVGLSESELESVSQLILKRNLKRDPEAQTLEDVTCLVFLEHYFDDFCEGRDEVQLVSIVQKAWNKISAVGRAHATSLVMSDQSQKLITKAVSDDS